MKNTTCNGVIQLLNRGAKFIDISMELNQKTVVWREDEPPKLINMASIEKEGCNFSWLSFSSHAGTHVDAPYYLFADKWSSEEIPLQRFIGECEVVDLSDLSCDVIAAHHLPAKFKSERVLLKTKNSLDPMEKYNPLHVCLSLEAAEHIIKQGVLTLGYDYQSFEREGKNKLHALFLKNSITLLDNLRLAAVCSGIYWLIALPLKVTGIDAAPLRAVLVSA